jgi:transcriptional regulator with XRE-family HTH domain
MLNAMPLRVWRIRAGFSQEELARRAGVAPKTITQAECGRVRPHPRTRKRIADALGMAIADIREFDEAA